MKTSITQVLKLAAVPALALAAITGCMTQSNDSYASDGSNVIISQESSNMGEVLNTQTTAAKVSGEHSDTGELIMHRLDTATCTDSSGQTHRCFIRDAKFTSSDTLFVRERQDTIWLLDSNGAYMTEFHPFQATVIIHNRHVTKVKGDKSLDIQFNTVLTRGTDSSGKKVLIWNGTINGTINGETVSATITNVTRPLQGGACGLPADGFIHMERGGSKIDIDFEGGGKAKVAITDRKGRRHHGNIDGGKETQND